MKLYLDPFRRGTNASIDTFVHDTNCLINFCFLIDRLSLSIYEKSINIMFLRNNVYNKNSRKKREEIPLCVGDSEKRYIIANQNDTHWKVCRFFPAFGNVTHNIFLKRHISIFSTEKRRYLSFFLFAFVCHINLNCIFCATVILVCNRIFRP